MCHCGIQAKAETLVSQLILHISVVGIFFQTVVFNDFTIVSYLHFCGFIRTNHEKFSLNSRTDTNSLTIFFNLLNINKINILTLAVGRANVNIFILNRYNKYTAIIIFETPL